MIIRGMIIIFICLFIYLFIGTAILEIMLWHVRKGDYIISGLLEEPVEESEQTLTVMFWPLLLPVLFIHMLKKIIKFMFKKTGVIIKGIRIFYTTIIFLIVASIHKEKRERKPTTQQANDEGEIYELLGEKETFGDPIKTIKIFDSATNGDVIRAMYPDIQIDYHEKTNLIDSNVTVFIKDCDTCQDYSIDFWNAPYKNEVEKNE